MKDLKIKILSGNKGQFLNPYDVPNRTDGDDEKYIAFDKANPPLDLTSPNDNVGALVEGEIAWQWKSKDFLPWKTMPLENMNNYKDFEDFSSYNGSLITQKAFHITDSVEENDFIDRQKQPFEAHIKLKQHVLRMANSGLTGSLSEWSEFLRELNNAVKEGEEKPNNLVTSIYLDRVDKQKNIVYGPGNDNYGRDKHPLLEKQPVVATPDVEENRLIAEFMGWKEMSHTKSKNWMLSKIVDGVEYAQNEKALSAMRFNVSWDWLMPVVEKIESLVIDARGVNVNIFNTGAYISLNESNASGNQFPKCVIANTLNNNYFINDNDLSALKKTKIQGTYDAVITFIKWYNLKNKEE